jgi:negative regulator of replication initiation
MMNGNVVLLSFKNKMDSIKKTIDDVEKVREVKKAMLKLLMSKKSYMEEDERMKFLHIDEKLYSWIDTQNYDITDTVQDALKILKSYNKSITL